MQGWDQFDVQECPNTIGSDPRTAESNNQDHAGIHVSRRFKGCDKVSPPRVCNSGIKKTTCSGL